MKRVRNTKHPSFNQIQNMTRNLKSKFGENANIQTITRSSIKYWISNGFEFFGWLATWDELQDKYRELMKRKV